MKFYLGKVLYNIVFLCLILEVDSWIIRYSILFMGESCYIFRDYLKFCLGNLFFFSLKKWCKSCVFLLLVIVMLIDWY